MNDLHHPCEPWAEQISLAVAGWLSPDEEQVALRHLETCPGCRDRFRQLTELCGAIVESRLPTVGTEADIIERVMSAVASDEARRPIDRTREGMVHPRPISRSLTHWRWVMRFPVSRVAASIVFILSATGVALWFHGSWATPAFADFAKPILEAKTAKFKIASEMKINGQTVVTSGDVVVLDAARSRQEIEMPDRSKMVMIFDWNQGKTLTLEPHTKTAMVLTTGKLPQEKVPIDKDPLGWLRFLLLDIRENQDFQRESLGEKELNGRRLVGFRITTRGSIVTLWGDPETGLPVRAGIAHALFADAKVTLSDFVFNSDLDQSLFSIEPPADYTVQDLGKIDISPAQEQDLIETLRKYVQLNQSSFPSSLDMRSIVQIVAEKFGRGMGVNPSEGQLRQMLQAQKKLQRGLMFALVLPLESDAHYAGKGVSLGAEETPIFWYRPQGADGYRIIYADLSVREAKSPPRVADAQPVPAITTP